MNVKTARGHTSRTISVSGSIAPAAVSIKVDTGANLYTGSESNALAFYQTERDGPNYIRNVLRNQPGHLVAQPEARHTNSVI